MANAVGISLGKQKKKAEITMERKKQWRKTFRREKKGVLRAPERKAFQSNFNPGWI